MDVQRQHRKRGFTLIELLVVIAIIAILVVAAAAGRAAGAGGRPADAVQEQPQADRPGAATITRALGSLPMGTYIPWVGFGGDNNTIALDYNPSDVSGSTGLQGPNWMIAILPFMEWNDLYLSNRAILTYPGVAVPPLGNYFSRELPRRRSSGSRRVFVENRDCRPEDPKLPLSDRSV